jgi:hypothetical protein
MDWNDQFGEGTVLGTTSATPGPGAVDLTQGGGGFNGMMTPMPEIEAAHIPAATPQEVEKRRSGWMQLVQKFQENPNLQRAMMLVGANLMQPLPPGQTPGGALGQSAVVGMNAYQMGQQQDVARQAALRKEEREERQLGFEERRVTEAERTGEVGRAATGEQTAERREMRPINLQTAQERLKELQAGGKRAAELHTAGARERELKALKAEIEAGLPRSVQVERVLAEINAELAKPALTAAQTEKAAAEAREGRAKAGITEQELALGVEGRAAIKARTQPTAFTAQAQYLEEAWKGSETLRRQNPDMKAWVVDITTKAKERPTAALRDVAQIIDSMDRNDPGRPAMMKLQRRMIDELEGGRSEAPASDQVSRQPTRGAPTKGARQVSRSGRPIVFDGTNWVYE